MYILRWFFAQGQSDSLAVHGAHMGHSSPADAETMKYKQRASIRRPPSPPTTEVAGGEEPPEGSGGGNCWRLDVLVNGIDFILDKKKLDFLGFFNTSNTPIKSSSIRFLKLFVIRVNLSQRYPCDDMVFVGLINIQ